MRWYIHVEPKEIVTLTPASMSGYLRPRTHTLLTKSIWHS